MADGSNRRPLKTRSAGWAKLLAGALRRTGISPNAISTLGIFCAAGGAWAFLLARDDPWWFLGAALGIQLRLLANMLDGMVAVEGGRQSPTGPLFNEVPDRIEDALLLIGAGYAANMPELGYGAALLAFATAYIRMTGGALGFAQDFVGPMAKQHRMFVLTVGAIVAAFGPAIAALDSPQPVIEGILWVIVAGAAVTCVKRLSRIARQLEAR